MASPGSRRALIVGDGAARGALAAARALAAAGWTVGVGSPAPDGLAAASRAARARHRIPAPGAGLGAFADAVAAAVERERYDVVFGSGDAEVLALSLLRARFRTVVPHAPHESVVRALDKLALTAAAQTAGLAVPRTWATPEEAADEHAGPVWVKARVHGPPDPPGVPARVVMELAPHPRAAARRVAEIAAFGGEAMLQEVVAGRLLSFATVVDGSGSPVAAVQQAADATWPPRAGVAARGHTEPVDARLMARVVDLLSELGWFGLAQLQFMVGADGEPRVIDLNGRFYGSLALAAGAGVNLPATWAALATGGAAPPPATPRAARYQWLEGDLRRAFAHRGPGRARELAGCLTYALGAHHSVASLRDPLPSFRLLAQLARRGIAHGRRAS